MFFLALFFIGKEGILIKKVRRKNQDVLSGAREIPRGHSRENGGKYGRK